ncbi:MAG: DUF1223 domain-containing protein [Pseudomonadota bacterium]
MKRIIAGLAALWITMGAAATAQQTPVVVELYTSQGCSSCPPADALMHKLAQRGDVIALSLHVDYWDYIGWKDPFADPAHAERQRAYARKAGRRSIYTPQMIIGGVDSVVGTHPMDVADLIAKHARSPKHVSVSVSRSGGKLQIAAKSVRAAPYDVLVASFDPKKTTKIKRGENAGKTLSYSNVVDDLQLVGSWNGKGALSLKANAPGGPVAVIIQHAGFGPIAAAAVLR